jgi:hypothetical protein
MVNNGHQESLYLLMAITCHQEVQPLLMTNNDIGHQDLILMATGH